MKTAIFSTDLVVNATKHKRFLMKLHELGITQQAASEWSLHRYLNLWLPLVYTVKEGANEEDNGSPDHLLPPPDISWLWHVHRLAPQEYIPYCRNHFRGHILEASPPFVLQWEKDDEEVVEGKGVIDAASTTRALWTRLYPDEPFFLVTERIQSEDKYGVEAGDGIKFETVTSNNTADGFDLIGSAIRQASFLWQISGERYEDQDFLEEGLLNYHRFLQMKPHASNMILVPTLQIDLLWHTHMLTNMSLYVEDCTKIMGGMLTHDDSQSDRSEGGILETSYHATAKLWKDVYDGKDYYVDGGMYRGEPPEQFYSTNWNATNTVTLLGTMLPHVRVMGASSASIDKAECVRKWADLDGCTSDGSPAFIPVNTNKPFLRIALKNLAKRDNYILFKGPKGLGYYHLETNEAVKEIARRCHRHVATMESDIACEQACCGSKANIKKKEKELEEMKEVTAIMDARSKSLWPYGELKDVKSIIHKRKNDTDRSSNDTPMYISDNGMWLYPLIIYETAGGACGGGVLTSGAACGGAACGM